MPHYRSMLQIDRLGNDPRVRRSSPPPLAGWAPGFGAPFLPPPPLGGGVGGGGRGMGHCLAATPRPPTPTLPHKGGGRRACPADASYPALHLHVPQRPGAADLGCVGCCCCAGCRFGEIIDRAEADR